MLRVIIDNQPDDEACEYHLFVENLIDLLAEMEGLEEELYEFEEVYEDYEELEEGKSKTRKKKKKRRKKKKKKSKSGPAPGSRHYKCQQKAKRTYDVWPCVPLHSEALTRRGWVTYDDLNIGDEILAYDRMSDTLKWTAVKNVHFFNDAEVFSLQKQHHKIECTMNHKWLTATRAYKKSFQERNRENISKAKQYFDLIQDVSSGKTTLIDAQSVLESTNFSHFIKKYKSLGFFEFCRQARVAKGAVANLKELREINFKQESLLTAAPLDPSYPPSDIGAVGKYSDNWIEKILSMSYDQVKAFFASAIIYDGHQSRDLNVDSRQRYSCNSYTFKQKDPMHSDIFELAAFLSGYNVRRGVKSSNGCTNFSVRENRFVSLDVMDLVEEPVQSVWCPETQYGTWVMRQNNRIMISGNSAYASGAVAKCKQGKIWKNLEESKSYEELLEMLLGSDSVVVSPNKSPETLEEVWLFEVKGESLRKWFGRKGGAGKPSGWVDCNTCRRDKKTGRKKCKPCGRKKGEKRAKYPACRPTPGKCKDKGRGKSWGKKTAKGKKKKKKSKKSKKK